MILEEGMVIEAFISKIVNDNNHRSQGIYYVESIGDTSTLIPLKEAGEALTWVRAGKPIIVGENTVTLGDWKYRAFASQRYVEDFDRKPITSKPAIKDILNDLTREELLALLKGKLNDETN